MSSASKRSISPHIRVETRANPDGAKRLLVSEVERVVAVGEDGTEVDISPCVTRWTRYGTWREIAKMELEVIGFRFVEVDEPEPVPQSRTDTPGQGQRTC